MDGHIQATHNKLQSRLRAYIVMLPAFCIGTYTHNYIHANKVFIPKLYFNDAGSKVDR